MSSTSGFDRLTESVARWTAKRFTRRSFLSNAGRVAMVSVAGSAITAVLADQAEARVCGQSGVSPKCPTYDCLAPGFWGYCWYASPGCCANGGLKKICDCCLAGWPNVQGYCPTGSAVYCVVESCLEDPRVQTVVLDRWIATDPVLAGVERSKTRPNAGVVVLANATETLAAALAVPVASELNAPILGISVSAIPAEVLAEITRLGATRVVVAAPGLNGGVLDALSSLTGVTVENITPTAAPGDFAVASLEIARWLQAATKRFEVVVIGTDGEAASLAPSAAAFARGLRAPLLVGADAARAFGTELDSTLTITAIGASLQGVFAEAAQFTRGSTVEISRALADRVIERDTGSLTVGFAPTVTGGFGYVVATNSIVLLHEPGPFADEFRDWITTRRRRFVRAELCIGGPAAYDNANIYLLQSAINGFDAHQLAGGGGDGLPVYSQPLEEQAIGKARVSGELPSTTGVPKPIRRSRVEDRFPVPTVVMPPPTSWPPGTTTTTLPPASATTLKPLRPASTIPGSAPTGPPPTAAAAASAVGATGTVNGVVRPKRVTPTTKPNKATKTTTTTPKK
jgi:hypothetical protein